VYKFTHFFTYSVWVFVNCVVVGRSRFGQEVMCLKETEKEKQLTNVTIPPIEPETSMQNITTELSSPWQLVAVVAGAGLVM